MMINKNDIFEVVKQCVKEEFVTYNVDREVTLFTNLKYVVDGLSFLNIKMDLENFYKIDILIAAPCVVYELVDYIHNNINSK